MQPNLSARWRRFVMGLQTVSGLRKQGYFIPYRHAEAPSGDLAYPAIEALLAQSQPVFQALLDDMAALAPLLAALDGPPPRPRWTQGWFARLDGAAAYTLVHHRRPARIVEVGSGHSTRFLQAAIDDGGFDCVFTAIDPAPRADIAALPIHHVPTVLQKADWAVFGKLEPGDILFIDSSHILVPGSDVDLVINQILPRLPAGVLVHFHDILLPDDYPAIWHWRGYNEQQGVGALLVGGGFEPLFASHYVATRMADQLSDNPVGALPLMDGVLETSLWLLKTAPALVSL